jgi:hypothetical protein
MELVWLLLLNWPLAFVSLVTISERLGDVDFTLRGWVVDPNHKAPNQVFPKNSWAWNEGEFHRRFYRNVAYSVLASFRIGTSGSGSFQRAKKS